MAHNKSGLHIIGNGSWDYLDSYLARCAALATVGPVGLIKAFQCIPPGTMASAAVVEASRSATLAAIKQIAVVSPSTFKIARIKVDEDDFPSVNWHWPDSASCKRSALHWMSEIYRWLDSPIDYLNPGGPKVREFVDAMEHINEPNMPLDKPGETEGALMVRWFDEWNRYCIDSANAHGVLLAVGGFSAGCPPYQHMDMLLGLGEYMVNNGNHIWAMHDGSTDDAIPFFRQNYPGAALRHRTWKQKADAAGKPFPRVALTEVYAYGDESDEYWQDWDWYLRELAKDDYVIGEAWFTLGDYEFSPGQSVNVAGDKLQRKTDVVCAINWRDAQPAPPTVQPNALDLDIKFLSQNTDTANDSYNDCGAACLAMQLISKGIGCTVNDVWRASGAGLGYMTFSDLKKAAPTYNCTLEARYNQTIDLLKAALRNGDAPILLVNAAYLWQPGKNPPYTGAHYVVATGILNDGTVVIHDPNNLPYTPQSNLADAWGNCNLQSNPDFAMLVLREGYTPPPSPPPPEPIGEPRVGVGMASLSIPDAVEIKAMLDANVEAVKLLTLPDPDDNRQMVNRITTALPGVNLYARLFFDPDEENQTPFAPTLFVDYVQNGARALYDAGVRYFEVHNEPNWKPEGWVWNWANGYEFGVWLSEALDWLRALMPLARFGFPGLSPGDAIFGLRDEAVSFFRAAKMTGVLDKVDWIGVHSYWWHPGDVFWGMLSETGGLAWRMIAREAPAGKPIVITEFSNNSPAISYADKGRQYADYYRTVRKSVSEAFAFALRWQGQDVNREAWVTSEGVETDLPIVLGNLV